MSKYIFLSVILVFINFSLLAQNKENLKNKDLKSFSIVNCASEVELNITRPLYPSLNPEGPFCPGETVNFCYEVIFTISEAGDPDGNNCQWIQGIIPIIGTGWDRNINDINNQGPTAWTWLPANSVHYNVASPILSSGTSCLGEPTLEFGDGGLMEGDGLPGGFWFTSPGGGASCDNDGTPDTMWGLPGSCGSTQTVSFCFDLTSRTPNVEEDCTDECFLDLAVEIFTFADGETGCYLSSDCAEDIPLIFNGIVECSTDNCGEDLDGDGFVSSVDCNDNDPSINPDASEICDGVDNNCDGEIDEGLVFEIYFVDADMDGYGIGDGFVDCITPLGTSTQGGDCDDSNPNINPAAIEICDGLDNNCNGSIDDGLIFITYYTDQDMDGFGSDESFDDCNQNLNYTTVSGDCDDTDPDINPIAIEIPNNDIDEDCDGELLVIDQDGDGWNSDEDCDDSNSNINPGATEIDGNGIDEDCDGVDGTSSSYIDRNSSVIIFPNPVSDNIFVDSKLPSLSYELWTIGGKMVDNGKVKTEINMTDMEHGLYVLKISDHDSSLTIIRRLVKI